MTTTRRNGWLLAILGLVPVTGSAAGGHYVVDDTGVAAPGTVDVEGWYSRQSGGNDRRAAVLAYGVHPGVEIALEGERERVDGADHDLVGIAGKWTLADAAERDLGVAVAGGVFMDPDTDRVTEAELFFPVDVPLADGRAVFRYNLGWSHQRDADNRDVATWGFGGEVALVGAVSAIAEIHGDQRDRTEIQSGLRVYLADRADLDVGYGWERRDPDRNWWTVGLSASF
ncbi:hypothetical protein [Aquisalimonas asiatica]|uniref:MetA-pathway of phenol degradation n=1 Tax=Aquisalimonas asiatica TaxID=406100 RepID=A0A1H8SUU5_9GAMM|nr:hypothetical protein [Aquisalimonas asiatica]SEO81963.1 hypothetical protein SAMN04488052_103189 [Aquisalimonas asiatica]